MHNLAMTDIKDMQFRSDRIRSVAQSCPTPCDPMNHSTPGLPVHHQLPELTQTHVHRVSDAIQPSHPLSSPSPLAPNPSQHQSLFQWVNSSHEVAKVLEFQLQHHSFQRNLLQDGLVGSPCRPRDSQEYSPTPKFKSSVYTFIHCILTTGWLCFLCLQTLNSWRAGAGLSLYVSDTVIPSNSVKNPKNTWTNYWD